MKALNLIGITFISLMLLYACEKQDDELILEQNFTLKGDFGNVDNEITVPFKASFTVWRALSPGTGECEEGSSRETMMMKGKGKMAHLGQLAEIFMTFCTAPTPEVIFPINYWFVETGKFVAANGDELHFVIESGQIMPYTGDNPEYQVNFNDDLVFIGGTGRFEGASGIAKTNAYVHAGSTENDGDDPFYTDFFMEEGTLTLIKGN